MNNNNSNINNGIIVAGGDTDPNLAALVTAFEISGKPCETLLVGANSHPKVTWDFEQDTLVINGQQWRPQAIFLRYDVFTNMADNRPSTSFRAMAWFTTIAGWAIAHPEVRSFNQASALHTTNKLHVLYLAREVGLDIPKTTVSNDHQLLSSLVAQQPMIAKPVNGGDYTRELAEIMQTAQQKEGSLAAPSIVQEQLVPPEIRVYWIAGRTYAFQLVADALDYRTTSDCKVIPLDDDAIPQKHLQALGRLMERLQMDFGAADFKACAQTGNLRFLELNNGPMFAAFDAACEGKLTLAMAEFLSTP